MAFTLFTKGGAAKPPVKDSKPGMKPTKPGVVAKPPVLPGKKFAAKPAKR